MAVVKHDYLDLQTAPDPLGEWNDNGLGTRTNEQLTDKRSYFRSLGLREDQNFLLEAVLHTDDANHAAVRLWARFKKDDGVGAYTMDTYSVEARLVAGAPRRVVLWDTFADAQVGAAIDLPAGEDWANATRGLRLRLRLVGGTLYLEAEPGYDVTGTTKQWVCPPAGSVAVALSALTAGDGSHWELGFGNARDVTIAGHTDWWDVHVMTLDDQSLALPHPPALVRDDDLLTDGTFAVTHIKHADPLQHDSDAVNVEVQCSDGVLPNKYLATDKVVLALSCPAHTDPPAHDFGNAPDSGSHIFTGITDHQTVTAIVQAIDTVCGRVVETESDQWLKRHIGVRTVPGGSQVLPAGRERLRYQSLIEAVLVGTPTGDVIQWDFDAVGSNTELALDSVTYANPGDVQNTVRTPVSPVGYLPDSGGGGVTNYQVVVTATLRPGAPDEEGGNPVLLSLDVADTKDNLDAAVLLDRSGSMMGGRWQAACNGAQMFATLVSQANALGGDHRAGVYWFWGNSSSGPQNYPNDAAYDGGEGYHGTFPPEAGTAAGDQLTLGNNLAVTNPAPFVFDSSHPKTPDHYTALGSGLLHCRDELVQFGPTSARTRDRMIVVLSDGMENRFPKLQQVFYDDPATDPARHWNVYTEPGDATAAVHDPLIRIFSAAVHTGPPWVGQLRALSDHLGGDGALDVKPIASGAVDGIAIQNWFREVFNGLYGLTPLVSPADPTCDPGVTKTQKATVVLGQDCLIFYLLQEDADPDGWEFSVKIPDVNVVIHKDNVGDYACARYIECSMHKMIVVRAPLDIPGHEHRWPGEWVMRAKRTAGSQGTFAMGAMAHQDFTANVDVIAPVRPRPGDTARLRVELKDRNGNRLPDAKVTTRIQQPGPWAGDLLARRMAKDLKLVKDLRKSTQMADQDMSDVADRVLRRMIAKGELPSGKGYSRGVPQVAPGIYELDVALKTPGTYGFDTTIEGSRRFTRDFVDKRLQPLRRQLRRNLSSPKLLASELRLLEHRISTRQAFHLETRNTVGVQLDTSLKHTPTEGYFTYDKVIRLELTPTDAKRRMLGPGWAGDVVFEGPASLPGRWPSVDGGNGAYWVDIGVKARRPRFDVARRMLVAERLELRHPTLGLVRPLRDELPLGGFVAVVQGVRVPIPVQALVGNKSQCEVHLATCKHAQVIAPKHRVPFHDLEAASDAGFDSCEVCLPLICNMSPSHMEAHKPFCGSVGQIAPRNRLEVTSWSAAKKLGFDGCGHCLPDQHTRRIKGKGRPR